MGLTETDEEFEVLTESDLKDMMWEAYYEGYKLGHDVEEMQKINERTANSHFNRWFGRNHE